MVNSHLKILVLGHREGDTRTIIEAFFGAHYTPRVTRATAAEVRVEAILEYDLVVSTIESARRFDATSLATNIPAWIIVDEHQGEALEQSLVPFDAQDYLSITQLGRLGPVVERALERHRLGKTEPHVRQSEIQAHRSLKLVLNAAKMGFWEWDLSTNTMLWSPECLAMIGLETANAPIDAYYARLRSGDAQQLRMEIDSAIARRESFSREVGLVLPDCGTLWLWTSGNYDAGYAGMPDRFVGFVQDVTDRMLAQHTLAESESRLKAAQRMAGLGAWEWDLDQSIWWSEELFRIAGHDPGTFVPTREECLRILPDETQALMRTAIREAIDRDASYRLKHVIRRSDGGLRWIDSFGVVERNCVGTPIRLWGICRDITDQEHFNNERRASERRFRESEMRYAAISEITRSVTFAVRFKAGKLIQVEWVQPRFGLLSGYSEEEFLRAGWSVIFHPQDRAGVEQLLKNASEGRIERKEVRILTKSGKELTVLLQGMLFERGPAPDEGLVIGGFIDITEIKAIEVALRASEERFQLALRGANEGLWDVDLERDTVFFSPRWKAILGYTDAELPNRIDLWLELVHPDDRDAAHEHVRKFLDSTDENYESEFRMRHKSGVYLDILSRGFVNRDEQGRPIRMVGTHQDITERKQADEERRASRQRLEVLSRQLITTREAELRHLARELHDEIGQGLTAMKMNIRAIQRSVSETHEVKLRLEETVTLIERTVDQVRNLSLNMRPPHLDDLGLPAALHWFLKQQAKLGGFQDHLSVRPPDLIVPTDLATVCYRITQEAVTNTMRHAQASRIEIRLWENNGILCLSIRDNGVGFDVGLARKRAAEGSSLGLISMHERAKLAAGQLEIESAEGEGTMVSAQFPLTRQ